MKAVTLLVLTLLAGAASADQITLDPGGALQYDRWAATCASTTTMESTANDFDDNGNPVTILAAQSTCRLSSRPCCRIVTFQYCWNVTYDRTGARIDYNQFASHTWDEGEPAQSCGGDPDATFTDTDGAQLWTESPYAVFSTDAVGIEPYINLTVNPDGSWNYESNITDAVWFHLRERDPLDSRWHNVAVPDFSQGAGLYRFRMIAKLADGSKVRSDVVKVTL